MHPSSQSWLCWEVGLEIYYNDDGRWDVAMTHAKHTFFKTHFKVWVICWWHKGKRISWLHQLQFYRHSTENVAFLGKQARMNSSFHGYSFTTGINCSAHISLKIVTVHHGIFKILLLVLKFQYWSTLRLHGYYSSSWIHIVQMNLWEFMSLNASSKCSNPSLMCWISLGLSNVLSQRDQTKCNPSINSQKTCETLQANYQLYICFHICSVPNILYVAHIVASLVASKKEMILYRTMYSGEEQRHILVLL